MATAVDVNNRTYEGLEALQQTAPAIASILLSLRKATAAIVADERHSDEYKVQQLEAVRRDAADSLDAVRRSVEATKQAVVNVVAEATGEQATGTVEEQLLAEQRLGRAWQRAVRQLDGGTDPIEVARRAVADGDRDVVAALRAELPAYLRSGGSGSDAIGGTMQLVDLELVPLLDEGELKAREVQAELEQLAYGAQWSLSEARTEIEGGDEAQVLPVTKDRLLPVSEEAKARLESVRGRAEVLPVAEAA